MTALQDVDIELLLDLVASSDGNLALATERLNKKLGLQYNTILEYEVQSRIASLDVQTSDMLAAKFRSLLTIKLYHLIHLVTEQVQAVLVDLKPAELARTHTSLVNSFTALTAPSTKVTFDFDREVLELAREFNVPVEEVRGELKGMEVKLKAVK